jgi:hypothetical protein
LIGALERVLSEEEWQERSTVAATMILFAFLKHRATGQDRQVE